MMLFTHLLVGLLVGLLAAPLGGGPPALAAGLVGGLLPDLDMVADHRRTLHFPVAFGAVGGPLALAGVLTGSTGALLLGTLLVAAWCHSVMDVFGSARELRPWDRTSSEAVFNHALGRWHAPRRFVYDGSPGDFALCLVLAGLVHWHGDPLGNGIALLLVAPAAIYTLSRRRLATLIPEEYESLSPFLKTQLRSLVERLRAMAGTLRRRAS